MTNLLIATAASSGALSTATGQSGGADYTIVFCIISLFLCIALPLGTILLGTLKWDGSVLQTVLGICGFIVFSVFIPSLISSILMPGFVEQEASGVQVSVSLVVKILCEALGMMLLLKLTAKKCKGLGNALNFGAGYCVVECFFIAFALVAYIIVILNEDVDKIYFLRELRVYIQKNNLVQGEEWRFILRGFTAVVFCAQQLSSAVVMFVAVQEKAYWLGLFSIAFALLIRLPNRLHSFDAWFWGRYAVIIPYLAVMAVLVSVVAYVIWKKSKER